MIQGYVGGGEKIVPGEVKVSGGFILRVKRAARSYTCNKSTGSSVCSLYFA